MEPHKPHPAHLPNPRAGQGLTEYLILLVLISMVSIAAVRSMGTTIERKIQQARENINGLSTDGRQ